MMKNKKVFIAALLAVCLFCCCAFSYAEWSSGLNASGTVQTEGKFDVYFVKKGDSNDTKYKLNDNETYLDADSIKVIATSTDNYSQALSLAISVPAAYATTDSTTIKVKVRNNGTMDAVVHVDSILSDTNSGTAVFRLTSSNTAIAAQTTGEVELTLTRVGTTNPGSTYSGIQLKLVYVPSPPTKEPVLQHTHPTK